MVRVATVLILLFGVAGIYGSAINRKMAPPKRANSGLPKTKTEPQINKELGYDGPEQKVQVRTQDDIKNGIASSKPFWPKNGNGELKIPYVIDNSLASFAGELRGFIGEMNQAITCNSNVWVERTNEADYIAFVNGNGCASWVGKLSRGGRQEIDLANPGCTSRGTVMHEMMHALGFFHEHERSDRNNFVEIQTQNIQAGAESQFRLESTTDYGVPYDYTSVMHYDKTAFLKSELGSTDAITIRTLDASQQDVIGQRNGLAPSDILQINLAYECPITTLGPGETTQPPTTTTATTTEEECVDRDSSCASYGREYCVPEWPYMTTYCRRFCGYCGDGCYDVVSNCYIYGNGACTEYFDWMNANCQEFCGYCPTTPQPTTPQPTTPQPTTPQPTTPPSTTPQPTPPQPTTPPSTTPQPTTPQPTTPPVDDCADTNLGCPAWKIFCSTNNDVAQQCPLTCGTCTSNCLDSDPYCFIWSALCTTNAVVSQNCQRSCNLCTGTIPVKK